MWLCLFYIIVDKYRPMVYGDVRVVNQNRERRNLHRENRWISRIMKATPTLTVPCVRRCEGCESESRKARFYSLSGARGTTPSGMGH